MKATLVTASAVLLAVSSSTSVLAHPNPAFANAHGLINHHHTNLKRMQRKHSAKRAAVLPPWERPLKAKRSSPSDMILASTAGSSLGAGTVTTQPDNIAEGTATADEGCTMWHTPSAGEYCSMIIAKSDGLDLADFFHLNPSVSADCKDLQIGLAYCIDTDDSATGTDSDDSDATCSQTPTATANINVNVAVKSGAVALPTPSASGGTRKHRTHSGVPSSAPSVSPAPASGNNNNNNAGSDSSSSNSGSSNSSDSNSDDDGSSASSIAGSIVSGLIKVTDPGQCKTVGAQKSTTAEAGPNGSIEWLNCGISKTNVNGQWNPPKITLDQVVVKPLTPGDIFYQSCSSQVIDTFNQVGKEVGIPPAFLASFAMQESSCQPNARGDNGGAWGLMQITTDKCGGAPGGDCTNIYYNVKTGAAYFKGLLDNNGGDLLQAIGSYNGWFDKITYADATKAAYSSCCVCQNNLDYLHQYLNAWCQGLDGGQFKFYNNLQTCGGSQSGNSRLARRWLEQQQQKK